MKKFLCVILSVLFIISILPFSAFSSSDVEVDLEETNTNKIIINSMGNGVATSSLSEATADDTITLTATPYSSSLFVGWYENDVFLSNSTNYNLKIKKDTFIIAKFTDDNLLVNKNTPENWGSCGYTKFAVSKETCYGGSAVAFNNGVRYQAQCYKMNLSPNSEYTFQFSVKAGVGLESVYILNSSAQFSDLSNGGILKNPAVSLEKTLFDGVNKDISSWTDLSVTFKTSTSENLTDTYYLYLKFNGNVTSDVLGNKAYLSDMSLVEKSNSFATFEGNSIRTTGAQGLRYTYKLATNLLTDGYYGYTVKEIGALAIKSLYLGNNALEKDRVYTYNQKEYLPVPGIFYNKENGINKVSEQGHVSALLYNTGYDKTKKNEDYSAYAQNYVVRVYMDIDYNGKNLTIYHDMDKASVFAVMDTIIESYEQASPNPTEELYNDYNSIQAFLALNKKDKNNKTISETYTTNVTDVALDAPVVLINPTESEYQDSKRQWQGIPSIAKDDASGRLWATWYSGGSGEGNSNWSVLYTSDDDGETWEGPKVVVNPQNPSVRSYDPNLWVDPNGRLWFFWNQSYTYFDGRCGVWAMYTDNPSNSNPTWSKPTRIANGVAMNDPVVLEDGSWLLPTSIWRPDRLILESNPIISENSDNWYYINKNYKLMGDEVNPNVYISTDNGESWSYYSSVKSYEGKAEFDEHMIAQRNDGSLIMVIRTASGIQESYSTDGGKTWSNAVHTGITNVSSRTYLAKLESNNLLLIYNDPPNRSNTRSYMTAALSTDGGVTWRYKFVIDERSGTSYPDAYQDSDGNIYVTYDYGRDANGNILMAKITEADIMAGEIVTEGSFLKKLVNNNTLTTK